MSRFVSAFVALAVFTTPALALGDDMVSTTISEPAVAFQVDTVHDGRTGPTALHLPLHIKWTVDLGQPLSYPLIADGRIFIVAGNTLYALDERTKNVLWSQVTQAAFGWVPGAAYENGKVFVVAAYTGAGAAIFAFNDVSAIGAIRAVREAGLRVPQDVSVVGFDDVQSAAFQNPALTTVRQPLRTMGILAAEAIARQIASPSDHPPSRQVIVDPELVVRDSTCPPSAKKPARA